MEAEEQVAQIPRLAEERALMVIEKKEILHKKEMQKLRKQHTDTLYSLQSKCDALSKEYRSLESATAMRIERLEREKNNLLARLKAMLDCCTKRLRRLSRRLWSSPSRY